MAHGHNLRLLGYDTPLSVRRVVNCRVIYLVLQVKQFLLTVMYRNGSTVFMTPTSTRNTLCRVILIKLSQGVVIFLTIFWHKFPIGRPIINEIMLRTLSVISYNVVNYDVFSVILGSSTGDCRPCNVSIINLNVSIILTCYTQQKEKSYAEENCANISTVLFNVTVTTTWSTRDSNRKGDHGLVFIFQELVRPYVSVTTV